MSGKSESYESFRPGCLYRINNVRVRAAKTKKECEGCCFNNPITCPNIKCSNRESDTLPCWYNFIIFIRV